jgi:hypothetical protein
MQDGKCHFKSGDVVRVTDRQDVPPPFARSEGVILSAESTTFGCLYRVRLLSRTIDDIGNKVWRPRFTKTN